MKEEEKDAQEESKDAANKVEQDAEDEFKFVEAVFEIESSDSILIVFSDGSSWSIFENI